MENTSMNASQEDLHKIERQLSERIHTVHLDATKMIVRRRNEALAFFMVIVVVSAFLSNFALDEFVNTKINEFGGEKIELLADRSEEATKTIEEKRDEAITLVAKLEKGDFVKTHELRGALEQIQELRDDLSGTKTQLSQIKSRTEHYLDGRIWKDKSKDRKKNTLYRNNTGFPIEVVVSISPVGKGPEHCDLRLYINNMLVMKDGQIRSSLVMEDGQLVDGYDELVNVEDRNTCSGTVTVPPDAKYKIITGPIPSIPDLDLLVKRWFELRWFELRWFELSAPATH